MDLRDRILDTLACGPMSSPELSARLGVADNLVRAELHRLRGECRVFESAGSWRTAGLLAEAAQCTGPLANPLRRVAGEVL
jgi:predicted ArsR family transcriptional regulator